MPNPTGIPGQSVGGKRGESRVLRPLLAAVVGWRKGHGNRVGRGGGGEGVAAFVTLKEVG